ncbi:MAG: hypothetical protein QOG72_1164 [Sphingomonadales bacterium]|nr:hypothetical protein [Sphingomonadales bacterium]
MLHAERALLAVEDERALARRDELEVAIDLWKAMGGAESRAVASRLR